MKVAPTVPRRSRSTFRMMGGLFAVLALQLLIAGEVWRSLQRVDAAAAADASAQTATANVQRAVLALQVTESRLSDYLRTQAVADHRAFDAELASFGDAAEAAAVNPDTGVAVRAALDNVRGVLAEIIDANDAGRTLAGQLLQTTAALENALGALAPAASRAEARGVLEAALNAATAAARTLAAARSYAANGMARDADKARDSIAASQDAVTAMLQAAPGPPPERLGRVAGAITKALDALDAPMSGLSNAVERRADATARLAVAAAAAREAMRNAQNQIDGERAARLNDMADAKAVMRRTVLFSAAMATLLGLVLTGLVGLSKYRSTQLEDLATRDPLTGLANRRSAGELIDKLWKDRKIEKTGIAFIMADIDQFKRLNDSAGHGAGDDCIRRVAGTIEASVRQGSDVVFRWGGEEFFIVLTKVTPDLAFTLAERIRAAIEGLEIENPGIHKPDGSTGQVTISLGVAFARDGVEADEVTKWADAALYDAKRSGRNAVSFSTGQPGAAARCIPAYRRSFR